MSARSVSVVIRGTGMTPESPSCTTAQNAALLLINTKMILFTTDGTRQNLLGRRRRNRLPGTHRREVELRFYPSLKRFTCIVPFEGGR